MATDLSSNGILASIPGEYIGGKGHLLPPAVKGAPEFAQIDLEVPGFGLVRVRYRLQSSAHGRAARRWFWTPWHAEQISG